MTHRLASTSCLRFLLFPPSSLLLLSPSPFLILADLVISFSKPSQKRKDERGGKYHSHLEAMNLDNIWTSDAWKTKVNNIDCHRWPLDPVRGELYHSEDLPIF